MQRALPAWRTGLVDALRGLLARGVYDVAFLENELPQFGFRYDRTSDRLWYDGRSVALGAFTPDKIALEVGETFMPAASNLNLLVDATSTSAAVIRLLYPGRVPPSTQVRDRSRGLAGDLELLAQAPPPDSRLH